MVHSATSYKDVYRTKENSTNIRPDGHLNNSMEFCRLLMDFVIGCIGNKENCDKVFTMLRELEE